MKLIRFLAILWQYRYAEWRNAFRVAYGCTFRGLPF